MFSIMERFERAVVLGAACWKMLMLDKEMLLFPIMSTLALAGLVAGAVIPIIQSPELQTMLASLGDNPQLENDPRFWAGMFVVYFIASFVMIFFNAGLLTCAMIRFAGGDPTVMDGLRSSARNLPQILAWTLVTATVGWFLAMLESRFKGLGRIFVNLLGAGWAVATYFAVPILVVDKVGPVEAVKRSVKAVRKTWGEALIGHVGLGALNFIGMIIALPLLVGGALRIETDPTIGVAALSLGVIWLLLCTLVITTLSAILRAALYIYAVEGEMPVNFDSKLIQNAFQPK